MEVLLLTDIPGIGKRNDVLIVGNGFALNHLLPARHALVVTPSVRRRYAEHIKQRALEREREKSTQGMVLASLKDKVVEMKRKASKTGKLYAATSAKMIADAVGAQLSIGIVEQAVLIAEPIKSIGKHTVSVKLGEQSMPLTVDVKADDKAAE